MKYIYIYICIHIHVCIFVCVLNLYLYQTFRWHAHTCDIYGIKYPSNKGSSAPCLYPCIHDYVDIYTHIYTHIYIHIKRYIYMYRYGLNMGIGRTCMTPAASSSPMRHDLGFAEGEPWRRQGFNAPEYARKSIFWVPLNPPPPAPVAPPAHTQHCFHNLSQLCICYCSSTHTTTCRINKKQEHLSQQSPSIRY